MATSESFILYVCEQLADCNQVRYKKMFGEYMVYVWDKPIFLVCDNTVYVKMLDCVAPLLKDAAVRTPYSGSKPHFVLDIDDKELCLQVAEILHPVTPLPKPRKNKAK